MKNIAKPAENAFAESVKTNILKIMSRISGKRSNNFFQDQKLKCPLQLYGCNYASRCHIPN